MIKPIPTTTGPEAYSVATSEQPKTPSPKPSPTSSRPASRNQGSTMRHLLQEQMQGNVAQNTNNASASHTQATAAVAAESNWLPTTTINVATLWQNWQPSQRDLNIHRPTVEKYKADIRNGVPIPPIRISDIFAEESGQAVIRTADGRHRLTAAYESHLPTISVVDSEMATMAKEIFGA